MKWNGSLLVAALFSALCAAPVGAASPSAEVLTKALRYHDPEGLWLDSVWRLTLEETRPQGEPRSTVLLFDAVGERFEWRRQQGGADASVLEGSLTRGECRLLLDGSADFTAEDREKHRLTCERLELWRDYYGYLWGLPMKLRDPGTVLAPEASETEFDGRPVLSIRVTYEESVGDDIWYFYFDLETGALAGYRFYHDEAANDGEYILFSDEVEAEGVRLPKARTWYTHAADELLGTDTLVRLERLSPPRE